MVSIVLTYLYIYLLILYIDFQIIYKLYTPKVRYTPGERRHLLPFEDLLFLTELLFNNFGNFLTTAVFFTGPFFGSMIL